MMSKLKTIFVFFVVSSSAGANIRFCPEIITGVVVDSMSTTAVFKSKIKKKESDKTRKEKTKDRKDEFARRELVRKNFSQPVYDTLLYLAGDKTKKEDREISKYLASALKKCRSKDPMDVGHGALLKLLDLDLKGIADQLLKRELIAGKKESWYWATRTEAKRHEHNAKINSKSLLSSPVDYSKIKDKNSYIKTLLAPSKVCKSWDVRRLPGIAESESTKVISTYFVSLTAQKASKAFSDKYKTYDRSGVDSSYRYASARAACSMFPRSYVVRSFQKSGACVCQLGDDVRTPKARIEAAKKIVEGGKPPAIVDYKNPKGKLDQWRIAFGKKADDLRKKNQALGKRYNSAIKRGVSAGKLPPPFQTGVESSIKTQESSSTAVDLTLNKTLKDESNPVNRVKAYSDDYKQRESINTVMSEIESNLEEISKKISAVEKKDPKNDQNSCADLKTLLDSLEFLAGEGDNGVLQVTGATEDGCFSDGIVVFRLKDSLKCLPRGDFVCAGTPGMIGLSGIVGKGVDPEKRKGELNTKTEEMYQGDATTKAINIIDALEQCRAVDSFTPDRIPVSRDPNTGGDQKKG